jgi:hypothetical protein
MVNETLFRLIYQLDTVSDKQDLSVPLNRVTYQLDRDHGLAAACWTNDENTRLSGCLYPRNPIKLVIAKFHKALIHPVTIVAVMRHLPQEILESGTLLSLGQ